MPGKFIVLAAFLFCCPLNLRAVQARAIGEGISEKLIKNEARRIVLIEFHPPENGTALKKIESVITENGIEIVPRDISRDISANIDFETENPEAMRQINALFGIDAVVLLKREKSGICVKIISAEKGKTVFEKTYISDSPVPKIEKKRTKRKIKKRKRKSAGIKRKKNAAGALLGAAAYSSNFEDFNILKNNNSGAEYYANTLNINAEIFYEREISEDYSLVLTLGQKKMGEEEYTQPGSGIGVETKAAYAELSLARKISKKFSIYGGAGADNLKYSLSDPVPLSGVNVIHEGFGGTATTGHLQAGVAYAPGKFIVKMGVKKIFSPKGAKFSARVTGGVYPPGEYDIIIRNSSSLDFKPSGSALPSNEEYLEAKLGGTEAFIMIGCKFNW